MMAGSSSYRRRQEASAPGSAEGRVPLRAGLPDRAVELEPAGGPEEYARLLYGRLRLVDRLGIDVLLAVPPAEVGVGIAVGDRLRRAAAAH